MRRIDAIRSIVRALKDEPIVHATGMISRESFTAQDRPGNFYMIGSMGLNSAIALGIALSRPERDIVILDGDGSVLMNMGMLASIGELAPKNLLHIVLDNESYASTGGQRSISDKVSLARVAAAAGYKYVRQVHTPEGLAAELEALGTRPRPLFLLVKVEPGNAPDLPRVSLTPQEIKARFMQAVCGRG